MLKKFLSVEKTNLASKECAVALHCTANNLTEIHSHFFAGAIKQKWSVVEGLKNETHAITQRETDRQKDEKQKRLLT